MQSCYLQKIGLKIDIVSRAFAQIIDKLSDQYHMRFTLVSTGYEPWSKDLAQKIMKTSNSIINYRHQDTVNSVNLIDYDESNVVLYNGSSVLSEVLNKTKYVTHRLTMNLFFNLKYTETEVERRMLEFSNFTNKLIFPHDIYELAHSLENGSMWFMSNELFFNGTCEPFYHPINFFNSTEMKWKSKKFFNQYRVFNNCEIFMETKIEDTEEFSMKHALNGYEFTEAKMKITKHLNLTLETFAKKHSLVLFEDRNISAKFFHIQLLKFQIPFSKDWKKYYSSLM